MSDRVSRIFTERAPAPGGHYSQAVAFGGLLFVSGQLPVLPTGDHALAAECFATQTRQALTNLAAILEAAGAGLDDVLKVTIFISDMADWSECNKIYAEFFADSRPARTIVPAGRLHFGYAIEIDAIARLVAGRS